MGFTKTSALSLTNFHRVYQSQELQKSQHFSSEVQLKGNVSEILEVD